MSEDSKDTRKRDPNAGKMQNSEEFAEYVHAVSIPMKVAMVAIVVFFAGVLIYCVFGRVPVAIDVAVVVDSSGDCVCYVKADDRDGIEPGDTLEMGGETYTVSNVSAASTCVDETFDEYACKIGDLTIGDYVYLVTPEGTFSRGVYSATLIKDHLQPLTVLLSS